MPPTTLALCSATAQAECRMPAPFGLTDRHGVNWWDQVRDAGDRLLARHGVLAAFVYLAVEESGVPIPAQVTS